LLEQLAQLGHAGLSAAVQHLFQSFDHFNSTSWRATPRSTSVHNCAVTGGSLSGPCPSPNPSTLSSSTSSTPTARAFRSRPRAEWLARRDAKSRVAKLNDRR